MTTHERLKTGWIAFYSTLIAANGLSIAVLGKAEAGGLPIYGVWAWIAVLVFNAALIASYCHEGRGALRKIPGIAAILALVYATGGILLSGHRFQAPVLEPIYRVAQLFVGESAWVDPILNQSAAQGASNTIVLAFSIARLAALLATVSGVLALVRKILDELKSKVFFESGHIVLCGLGEAGLEFVRKWQRTYGSDRNRSGKRLVIIERNPLNPNVDVARDLGFGVMVGDVFDITVMQKARLDRAETVVMLLSDDKRNIELALELRHWIAERRATASHAKGDQGALSDATRLLIHVDDTGLARRLQDHSRAGAETYTDTRFFDFYETSARSLFQTFPMESSANLLDTNLVHLAIYGFSQMGEAVLREAVRLGVFPDRKPLRISIFDRRADEEEFKKGFWRSNPGLEALVSEDSAYRPIDVRVTFYRLQDARRGIDHELVRAAAENADDVPPTQHVICFDNDELSASFAIGLRDVLRQLPPQEAEGRPLSWDAPIFARLKRRHGLARLFLEGVADSESDRDLDDTPDTLYAFGMLDDLVDPEQLLDDRRDEFARVLHEFGYRPQRGEENPVKNIWRKQTNVPWRFLPLHYKGSNRAQADHVYVKLRSLGCGIHVPSRSGDPGSGMSPRNGSRVTLEKWGAFLDEPAGIEGRSGSPSATLLDGLARTEHDRWAVYHFLENWRYGTERADAARVHDNLTNWENLDDLTRSVDAKHIRKFPEFVEKLEEASLHSTAEKTICREVRVGIVGHLPERLEQSFPWMAANRDPTGTLPSGEGLPEEAKTLLLSTANQILEKASRESSDLPVKLVLVTAAAEGADRVLAEALLENQPLNPELEILLPLPWELYYMTFDDDYEARKASVEQFTRLVKRARSTMQLPMRFGSLETLGGSIRNSTRLSQDVSPHHKQFQLANAYLAQQCDYLLAAWDGKEIGSNPSGLPLGDLQNRIENLPDGSSERAHAEDARPGGAWEAVRWWLFPESIPPKMRWSVGYRTGQSVDQSARLERFHPLEFDGPEHEPGESEKR